MGDVVTRHPESRHGCGASQFQVWWCHARHSHLSVSIVVLRQYFTHTNPMQVCFVCMCADDLPCLLEDDDGDVHTFRWGLDCSPLSHARALEDTCVSREAA